MGGRLGGFGKSLRFLLVVSVMAAIVACSPIYRNHGYVPTEEELALLTVGVDTKDTVAGVIGRPSVAGLLNDLGWYYVQSRYQLRGPREPKEIERQVVSVSFDEDGVVTNIERFGLEEGRVITLSRRVTDQNIGNVTLISQLLRNFGRVNAGDYLQ